jgi:hypothetical protein
LVEKVAGLRSIAKGYLKKVNFKEVEPDENFDLRRFRSEPVGRWEAGVLKMFWGKARVRMALAAPLGAGWVPIDYWGGDQETALLLLGVILGTCAAVPEGITEEQLAGFFPRQEDKELGPLFWGELFGSGVRVRAVYGDFQE